jgi:hypothetical protein
MEQNCFFSWWSSQKQTNKIYINREIKRLKERLREVYFKELAHVTWELASPKSVGQASSLETQAEVLCLSLEALFLL